MSNLSNKLVTTVYKLNNKKHSVCLSSGKCRRSCLDICHHANGLCTTEQLIFFTFNMVSQSKVEGCGAHCETQRKNIGVKLYRVNTASLRFLVFDRITKILARNTSHHILDICLRLQLRFQIKDLKSFATNTKNITKIVFHLSNAGCHTASFSF